MDIRVIQWLTNDFDLTQCQVLFFSWNDNVYVAALHSTAVKGVGRPRRRV